MLRGLLGLLAAGLLSACTSLPAPVPAWERWSAAQGGLETGPTARAADAALARLAAACACPEIRVRVLASDRTEAYGWRDGSIFVTRGLVGALRPEELAAAIAHEIAHVRAEVADEAAADRIGVELLRASGLPPARMAEMLAKVLASDAPDPRIAARILALRGVDRAPLGDLVALLD